MIKNLIFDCGGVVFDVDYEKSFLEFKKLSQQPHIFNEISVFEFKHIASDYETGKQTTAEFLIDIRNKLSLEASDEQIISAWNSMLIGFINQSIESVKELKTRYNLALFSNTNELHFQSFSSVCNELLQLFEKIYFSHKIGFKKPDLASFHFVLNDSGYLPSETLFIDDSIENIHAANKLGINTLHYNSNWNLDKLTNYLMNL